MVSLKGGAGDDADDDEGVEVVAAHFELQELMDLLDDASRLL